MHYGYDTCNMGYGYGYPAYGYRNNFALIVVLFILLIIIGAAYVK
ncbi:YjcZ family sporulation protein [Bacillus salitolerans]|uniref:YjcZ family sporulation protein n=1 Tax=Bacillus salitolerans TaxID=1437434 RepID=A0ABW4LT77_9BACI